MSLHYLKQIPLSIVCIFLLPSLLNAEFYKWKDEDGNIHFTDNYHNIPEHYRKKVSQRNYGKKESSKKLSQDTPSQVVVNFEKQDNAIFVNAVLNWKHPVIFHLDTGATSTMITRQDVLALGIDPDAKPTTKAYIADGSVVELPVAVVSSIRVGDAEVKNVTVTIGRVRLLGMNFLNDFKVNIDAENGQLILERKDLVKQSESPSVKAEKDHAIEELENQIDQIEIAINAKEEIVQEIEADIRLGEEKRAKVESILKGAREGTRFESSDISADSSTKEKIDTLEETLESYDRRIEIRKGEIQLHQKQIDQLRERITYYERMIEKMR